MAIPDQNSNSYYQKISGKEILLSSQFFCQNITVKKYLEGSGFYHPNNLDRSDFWTFCQECYYCIIFPIFYFSQLYYEKNCPSLVKVSTNRVKSHEQTFLYVLCLSPYHHTMLRLRFGDFRFFFAFRVLFVKFSSLFCLFKFCLYKILSSQQILYFS